MHGFLTNDECEGIVAKARGGLQRSTSYDGEEVVDRTSEVVAVRQAELPTPTSKVLRLFSGFCNDARQLEAFQVIRYAAGQRFEAHLDAVDGLSTSSGFVDSARLATLFVYLADSPRGGETASPAARARRQGVGARLSQRALSPRPTGLPSAAAPHPADARHGGGALPDPRGRGRRVRRGPARAARGAAGGGREVAAGHVGVGERGAAGVGRRLDRGAQRR